MGIKMKTKILNLALIATLAICGYSVSSCTSDEESFVLRSDDNLSFSYAQDSKDFTICTNGDWSITSDCDWLSFSSVRGKGDGTTREKIVVTSAYNTQAARQGTFVLHAAGKDLTVTCQQEEGAPLTFGKGKVSGALKAGQQIEDISIEVPYSYGYAGQKITLHTTLSGAGSEGLKVNDKSFTLDAPAGTLSLPLEGKPTASGPLSIKIQSNDETANSIVIQCNVLSKILLEQHFDLMLWGGDVIAYKPGIKGVFVSGDGGKVIDTTQPATTCKATDDGSNDLILTMAESYRQLRGFSGWDGAKIYEHPGYVKMGTASAIGKLITPAISNLSEGTTRIKVTCRVAQYYKENGGAMIITVLGGGTPSVSSYTYKNAGTAKGGSWEEVAFMVNGVTAETQIQFSTQGNKRFCMDDIVISEEK